MSVKGKLCPVCVSMLSETYHLPEAAGGHLGTPRVPGSMDNWVTGDTFMQMPKFRYLKLKLVSQIISYGAMGHQST